MDPRNDEQTELLRNIWQEMKALGSNLGGRIDQTNAQLGQTNARLDLVRTELSEKIDAVRTELSGRIDETNARIDITNTRLEKVEETLRDLAAQQLMLTRYVKNVVDRHEQSLAEIRERLARLEARLDEPR